MAIYELVEKKILYEFIDIRRCGVSVNETTLHPNKKL